MGNEFSLAIYPWVYVAKFNGSGTWEEVHTEKPHQSPDQEAALPADEKQRLYQQRNHFEELPIVNYTTQYAMGCFEGLKAFPQKDGSLRLFRPHDNARRMARSMAGLLMPAYPEELFVGAVRAVVANNQRLGFAPAYDPAWEQDDFVSGQSVYVRPFTYTEGGIGVNLSQHPWVVIVTTRVGAYFDAGGQARTTTTKRVRANPGGTGWIKCSANYVTSALAKKEAENQGFMEALFLDAKEHRYIEEGSSCNVFFVLRDGSLVTPALEDTVLPGITRQTIIEFAKDRGMTVQERKVAVEEVFSEAVEAFATGTAAGVTHFSSLTHEGQTVTFGDGAMGKLTYGFLQQLKGLQYGTVEDRHGWMVTV